jgi:hypothetical protein
MQRSLICHGSLCALYHLLKHRAPVTLWFCSRRSMHVS